MGRKTELLNWDHEIIPTTKDDFMFNLKHRLAVINGYPLTNVTLIDDVLTVECGSYRNMPNGRLLTDGVEVYEETAPRLVMHTLAVMKVSSLGFVREIYGRATDIGESMFSLQAILEELA